MICHSACVHFIRDAIYVTWICVVHIWICAVYIWICAAHICLKGHSGCLPLHVSFVFWSNLIRRSNAPIKAVRNRIKIAASAHGTTTFKLYFCRHFCSVCPLDIPSKTLSSMEWCGFNCQQVNKKYLKVDVITWIIRLKIFEVKFHILTTQFKNKVLCCHLYIYMWNERARHIAFNNLNNFREEMV